MINISQIDGFRVASTLAHTPTKALLVLTTVFAESTKVEFQVKSYSLDKVKMDGASENLQEMVDLYNTK